MTLPASAFPLLIALLELAAAAVCFTQGKWQFGIVWAGVGVSNLAFASLH